MHCPNCHSDLANDDVLGYCLRGVYDGILYWICRRCGEAFPRFTGADGRLGALSTTYADQHNQLHREGA